MANRKTVMFPVEIAYALPGVQILKKITEGNSLIAIENSLKISSTEIKSSFKNIYDKLYELQK